VALLVAGVSSRRPFDDAYRSFYELLAVQFASAMSNAEVHESERARTQALAQIDRAKTAFFSNVSHEFRTPLTLLLSPLEDALNDPEVPVRAREPLRVAQRNARRLLKLVNSSKRVASKQRMNRCPSEAIRGMSPATFARPSSVPACGSMSIADSARWSSSIGACGIRSYSTCCRTH
jgi:signal transduction histidine kinase